ncbi:MAG: hypothetical protein WC222_04735 [Parachlamydiales bacterium]|jgi:hypothetical protein
MKIYSDKALSQQLEKTEARYNAEFVHSRLRMFPDSGAEWIEVEGTYAMFDGLESPLTQTFGLGLFEKLSLKTIEKLEKFYQRFSAPIFHEVSPMADSSHMDILCKCGYQPVELTSILYKPLLKKDSAYQLNPEIATRQMLEGEEEIWASTSAKGWSTEAPGLYEFIYKFAQIATQSRGVLSFFANLNDKPISTGMLYIDNDIALLAGDSTIMEGRNRGAQNALIDARLSYAADHGCSIAMMAASPGSQSQKNAEKKGFRLAYTRTKWKLRI